MSDDLKARMRQVAREADPLAIAGRGVDAVVEAMRAEHAAEIAPLVEALAHVIPLLDGMGPTEQHVRAAALHRHGQLTTELVEVGPRLLAKKNKQNSLAMIEGIADAAFDSVLASLDTPEMREAVAHAVAQAVFGHDARWVFQWNQADAVLAAVRAELTRET